MWCCGLFWEFRHWQRQTWRSRELLGWSSSTVHTLTLQVCRPLSSFDFEFNKSRSVDPVLLLDLPTIADGALPLSLEEMPPLLCSPFPTNCRLLRQMQQVFDGVEPRTSLGVCIRECPISCSKHCNKRRAFSIYSCVAIRSISKVKATPCTIWLRVIPSHVS
jgi:hypothetical protein